MPWCTSAEGYGTCSSKGFRLPLLFSLYFMLHSNCGVSALLASLCVICINSNLNKRWGQKKSWIFFRIYFCGSVYHSDWNYQAGWEWLEWSLTTALSEPAHTKSTLMGFWLLWVWPGITWHHNPPSWTEEKHHVIKFCPSSLSSPILFCVQCLGTYLRVLFYLIYSICVKGQMVPP